MTDHRSSLGFLEGGGRAGEIIRSVDWANSELGVPEAWPSNLKVAVGIVLHSSQATVLLWGPNFLTFYNESYFPALGSKFDGGIGEPYSLFRHDLWPAVQPYLEAALRGDGRSVQNLRVTTQRWGHDEEAYFSSSYSPVYGDHGHIDGVLAHLLETTKQVELQNALEKENRRFRELFRQAPGFLAIGRTSDYRFEFVNDAYQSLMGDRQLVGRPIAEALPEAEDQGFMKLLHEVERTGKPFFGKDMLFRIERPSGEWDELYLDFIYQPIKDENGRVTGILCSGIDVTHEHMEKQRADKLQTQLSHAARISFMGTMAATLAHEINQPLAAASNYLSGIRRILETLEGERRSAAITAAANVGQQIQRAGEIIRRARNLLSGRTAVRQVIDIDALAERAFREVASTDLCPGVQLKTEIAPEAKQIFADVIQIEQVMINLLRNACQAMEKCEHKEIRVATSLAGDNVQVRITDLGPGLSPDQRDTIFSEFGRSSTGGLGVGLALSRTIIEAHGGRIWPEAAPEGGATFAFEIPAREPERSA